jgi:hypothetical protein
MSAKIKLCPDCGVFQMIDETRIRCGNCHRKRLASPPKAKKDKAIRKKWKPKKLRPKPQHVTDGLFKGWVVSNLPMSVCKENKSPSNAALNHEQRIHLLSLWGYTSYANYLRSDLWLGIRAKVLSGDRLCCCGCQRLADQVHHTKYTEANLSGHSLSNMVPILAECHQYIEFCRGQKLSLKEANKRLREVQEIRLDTAKGSA